MIDKDKSQTFLPGVTIALVGAVFGSIGMLIVNPTSPNKTSHNQIEVVPGSHDRIQVLNIQGCEYITFNSQSIIHKANCTNEVHQAR